MSKRYIILSIIQDLIILAAVVFVTLYLRFTIIPVELNQEIGTFAFLAVTLLLASCYFFRVYHQIWQYAGINDFLNVAVAVTVGTLLVFITTLIFFPRISLHVIPLLWFASLFLLGGWRFARRLIWHFTYNVRRSKNHKRVLVIGAGEAGALIVRTLQASKTDTDVEPIGFIDDDKSKNGLQLYGLPVLGVRSDIPQVVQKYAVEEAIISIPSATAEQIKEINSLCLQANIKVKILPSVLDLIQGKELLSQVRELRMEDLLHRTEVNAKVKDAANYIKGRVVLVTGAGGSIGSELCRQICDIKPRQLLLLGRGENSIHEISIELAHDYPDINCESIIADIREEEKILSIFDRYKPAVVFHAAAHKHVHLMEMHPDEAFKNNVFGTLNLVRMADRFGTGIFVLISTDKAVNPTSTMGLTKLLAEMIISYYAEVSNTKFVAVRFGNVLGSRGSVVHLFRRQIAAGGPITITHPEMRRYFMTIREAVQLVIHAGALAKGGEVFMLDMGDQIKIVDLAKDMICLCGLSPGKDIEIKFVGMRPGEKLYEELVTDSEKTLPTLHKKIFRVETDSIDHQLVNMILTVQGFPKSEQLEPIMNLAILKFKTDN